MRKHDIDPEMKMAIVLEGLRGKTSISELCHKYQISKSAYYKWRDKFLEGGRSAISGKSGNREEQLKREIKNLQKIARKQAVHIEILEKHQR